MGVINQLMAMAIISIIVYEYWLGRVGTSLLTKKHLRGEGGQVFL